MASSSLAVVVRCCTRCDPCFLHLQTIKLQAEFSKDRVVLAPSFGRDPALFAFDGAHLSSKGYTAFTPLLLKSLQSSLATASGKVLAEAVATAAT